MQKSRFDAALNFGAVTLGAAGTTACANVLQIDKADPSYRAVNFIVETAAVGGTSVQLLIQGSNDNSTYVTVAESPVILEAKLVKDANFDVHIPQDWNYKYMRAAVTGAGTHTAGKITACMDVYPGV